MRAEVHVLVVDLRFEAHRWMLRRCRLAGRWRTARDDGGIGGALATLAGVGAGLVYLHRDETVPPSRGRAGGRDQEGPRLRARQLESEAPGRRLCAAGGAWRAGRSFHPRRVLDQGRQGFHGADHRSAATAIAVARAAASLTFVPTLCARGRHRGHPRRRRRGAQVHRASIAAEYGGDPARATSSATSAGGHRGRAPRRRPRGDEEAWRRASDRRRLHADLGDLGRRRHARLTRTRPSTSASTTRSSAPKSLGRVLAAAWARRPAPFAVVVGTRDYPYLIPQAERARARLEAVRAAPELHAIDGNDHEAMVLRFGAKNDDMTDVVVAFVSKELTRTAAR